jgi:Ca2+-binding RTX toxin-like protein
MADSSNGVVLTLDATTSVTFTGLTKAQFEASTTNAWVNISGTAEAAPSGTAFTLTTGNDTVAGTAYGDTITAVSSSTLNAADQIDGGTGSNDVINVDMNSSFAGFSGTGFLKNVETANLTNSGGKAFTFDASGVTGVTTYNLEGPLKLVLNGTSQTVKLTGSKNADSYEIDTKANSTSITVSGDLGGGTDEVEVDASAATGKDTVIKLSGLSGVESTEITGSSGKNTITGTSGADTISGGAGADNITGGVGIDTFVFANVSDIRKSTDTFKDYADGEKIEIHVKNFTQFVNGAGKEIEHKSGTLQANVSKKINVDETGGKFLLETSDNVVLFGDVANGLDGISDALKNGTKTEIRQSDGGLFVSSDELVVVVTNSTTNQIELGIVTIHGSDGFDGGANGKDQRYDHLASFDITNGLTGAKVADDIDFIA